MSLKQTLTKYPELAPLLDKITIEPIAINQLLEILGLLCRLNQFPVQLAQLRLALALDAYGEEHEPVLDALYDLAVTYQKSGSGAQAEVAYRRTLALAERIHGMDSSPVFALCLELHHVLRYQCDKPTEAVQFKRRAEEICSKAKKAKL